MIIKFLLVYVFITSSHGLSKDPPEEVHYTDIEAQLVDVDPDGEVHQIHLNQAERPRHNNHTPIYVIPDKKIVGGMETNPGEVPYQVAILDDSGSHICGGAVFNKNTVITAAHCFFASSGKISDNILSSYTFVAGEHSFRYKEGTEQIGIPQEVITHPNYNPKAYEFDIAIIKLRTQYKYTYAVQPISIGKPPLEAVADGEAQISGWGYTKRRKNGAQFNDLYYPSKLHYAEVDIISKDDCLRAYRTSSIMTRLAKNQRNFICAGKPSGVDSCQGDSGGPLACFDPTRRNKKFLCGVICTGVGCGMPGMPGLYTRVSSFQNWITQTGGYADRPTRRY